MILYAYLALVLVAAAYDLWSLTIPNPLTFGLAGLFVAVALLDPFAVPWLSHLGAGLLVFLAGAVAFRFRLFGGGDVKLWAATSLWIGLDALPLHLVYVALLGGALALAVAAARSVSPWLGGAFAALGARPLPRLLTPGEGIPYGVAIAGSALLLHQEVIDLQAAILGGV